MVGIAHLRQMSILNGMSSILKGIALITLLQFVWSPTFASFNKMAFWRTTPRGANMSSTNPASDFAAAKHYGIQLIRFGATGSPGDFRFFVKTTDGRDEWDLSSVNLERLRALATLSQQHDLKIIISLAHIPGRNWEFRKRDFRIWRQQRYRKDFVKAWKAIAETLVGFDNVVGYDLLNEPCLPTDESRNASNTALWSLYQDTVTAIRVIDSHTPIILEAAGMASPKGFNQIQLISDPMTIYSFHYYEPFPYFSPVLNQGKLNYPGLIPSEEGTEPTLWNKTEHLKTLGLVHDWQVKNQIQPFRIFVGEFGVWRKANGANTYLKDLTEIFNDFGWSWTYYAFRENDWDVADLELDGRSNVRSETPLFKILKEQFQ